MKGVWYAESWHQANLILKKDPNCQALFLPWHLYLSFDFNHDMIVANPAHIFFDCKIFYSRDLELGDASTGVLDMRYESINKIIKDDRLDDADLNTQKLSALGIKYVIFTKDLSGADSFQYNFLKSAQMRPIFEKKDLILYVFES